MKPHLVLTSLALIFSLAFTACVSIDINPSKITKADDYDFDSPDSPFESIKAAEADRAWQSKKTGNTISIITACDKNSEPSLKTLEADILAAMTNTKVISSSKVQLANTDALKTHVEGQVDGTAIHFLYYSLKRNNCSYSLNYVGRKSSFQSEIKSFEDFAKEFELE